MIKSSVPQQSPVSKPQGLEELGIDDRNILRYRGIIVRRQLDVLFISAHEAFVSFANDPGLASSVKGVKREMSQGAEVMLWVKVRKKPRTLRFLL